MGIAAYNRGSAAISRQIQSEARPVAFEVVDRLNATQRHSGAAAPFGDVHISQGNGGWWAACPATGYGFHYPCLRSLMAAWLVDIAEIDFARGEFIARPWDRARVEQHRIQRWEVVS